MTRINTIITPEAIAEFVFEDAIDTLSSLLKCDFETRQSINLSYTNPYHFCAYATQDFAVWGKPVTQLKKNHSSDSNCSYYEHRGVKYLNKWIDGILSKLSNVKNIYIMLSENMSNRYHYYLAKNKSDTKLVHILVNYKPNSEDYYINDSLYVKNCITHIKAEDLKPYELIPYSFK